MALTFQNYPISGTDYHVPFPYLVQAHVFVYRDGVLLTSGADYNWIDGETVRLVSATGSFLEIRRKTSWTSRLVDYSGGSGLTEDDLDIDSIQAFYMGQEATDIEDRAVTRNSAGQVDAEGTRIVNVANAVATTDAVTKAQLDAAMMVAGNVVAPGAGNIGKWLKATTAIAWDWASIAWSDISGLITANIAALKTALGLGTAAYLNVGTAAGNIVQLITGGKLPAVDGSNLTGLTSTSGRLIGRVIFTAGGTYTKNAAANYVIVKVLGGGGGAGSVKGGTSGNASAGSGAGAGYAEKLILNATLGATETVTIGAGGNGGADGAVNDGSDGGTSTFGSHCSATGGKGGVGIDYLAAKTALKDMSGGIGVGGDIHVRGSSGYTSNSYYGSTPYGGTRGGDGAGPYGGGGAHAPVHTTVTEINGNNAGANTGAGGSGGQVTAAGTSFAAGGNGGSGLVIVEEYA